MKIGKMRLENIDEKTDENIDLETQVLIDTSKHV